MSGAPAVDPRPPRGEPRGSGSTRRSAASIAASARRASPTIGMCARRSCDLGGVDVDVHDLRPLRERRPAPRSRGRRSGRRWRRSGPPRPSPSSRRACRACRASRATAGREAGNAPSAISVVVTGMPVTPRQRGQLGRRARRDDAAARVEHRPPRRRDRRRRAVHLSPVGLVAGPVAGQRGRLPPGLARPWPSWPGTSTTTGPGARRATWIASWIARATWSAPSTAIECLTIGCVIPITSPPGTP